MPPGCVTHDNQINKTRCGDNSDYSYEIFGQELEFFLTNMVLDKQRKIIKLHYNKHHMTG